MRASRTVRASTGPMLAPVRENPSTRGKVNTKSLLAFDRFWETKSRVSLMMSVLIRRSYTLAVPAPKTRCTAQTELNRERRNPKAEWQRMGRQRGGYCRVWGKENMLKVHCMEHSK